MLANCLHFFEPEQNCHDKSLLFLIFLKYDRPRLRPVEYLRYLPDRYLRDRKGRHIVVVTNHNRTNAIVIRCDGASVTLVPMKGGKLLACTLPFTEFRTEWQEIDYALDKALEIFLQHVTEEGASAEVVKGLTKLKARDEQMASLF